MAVDTDSGGHIGYKIIAGIITSVVGTAAVYYLGFHDSKTSPAEEMMFTKEATINSWNTYVSSENAFNRNWGTLSNNYSDAGFQRFKKESFKEITKLKNDIKKIIETKHLDASFQSLLERRLEAMDEWEDKYYTHLDNFEKIIRIDDQTEREEKRNKELRRFQDDIKDIVERFQNEIEDLTKALNNKYNYRFSPSELLAFQKKEEDKKEEVKKEDNTRQTTIDRQNLVGNWLIPPSWYIYQYNDGRLYMYFGPDDKRDSVYGTWELLNNQLYQYSNYYFNAGNKWVYILSNVTPNSFVIKSVDSPYYQYTVQRRTN